MEQTSNVTPAQTAPTTPSTTVAAKTQAKKALEPATEAEFKNELRSKVQEARSTPAMLLVPKLGMQGPTDAKIRVASRFLLEKVEWIDSDGTTKLQAELGDAFKSATQYFMGSVATPFIKVLPKQLSGQAQEAMGRKLSDHFHIAFNFPVESPKFVWHIPSSPACMQAFVQAVSEASVKLQIEVTAIGWSAAGRASPRRWPR